MRDVTTMTTIERLPRDWPDALAYGTGRRTPYERELSIDEVFTRAARVRPLARAVTGTDGTLTYDEVERGSNRVANALRSLGVSPGAAVGVACDRTVTLPVVLLGILKAGAAYVPLDPAYPRERTCWMIEDAGVSLVIEHDARAMPEIQVDRLRADEILEHDDDEPPAVVSGPASLAYVMYTSGSTGRPKGVAVEHRGVVRLVRGTDYLTIGPSDTFLQFASPAFDASTFEIWAPLLNGAELAVPKPGLLTMGELAETIDRFSVTTMFLTTALFQRLVDTPSARPRSLRTLMTGGEVASSAHMARFLREFPDCRLVAVYGPTENTTFSTWCDISPAETLGPSVPIGKPLANSTAFVLDGALRPVRAGVDGELFVGGDGIARGYVSRPELTAEKFVPDPFAEDPAARLYRTGDRARRRPDGLLEFLGRNDDQVKIRGFRIELGEVESALEKHDAVSDVVVVVAECEGEKELVAHVVLCSEAAAGERELRAWLSRALPSFMLPHRIVVRREMPLTPSGKVDRVALASSTAVSTVGVSPRARAMVGSMVEGRSTGLSGTIAEIWRDVLRSDITPGLDENFFDAGGDSLRLLAVHARLRERLGADVTVTDLFEHCTIRKLTALLRSVQES